MIDLDRLLQNTIPDHILNRSMLVLRTKLKPIRLLLEQRRLPETGWEDDLIQFFLTLLSWMDTDKDREGARIGEREGRVAAPVVSDLASGYCHGVGRSGSLRAPQPKAGGASIAHFFADKLALDMLRRCGVPNYESAAVLPLATGMAIGLAATVAREETGKRGVVYPRVDHKSPMKGLLLSGMKVKTVESVVFGDAVRIPVAKVAEALDEETAAVVSTTTFFPPRESDDVKAIAKLAEDEGVFHIINNAYGVQSRQIMNQIQGAIDAGRVDIVVQSTDKNFLTPVGGSIVASPSFESVEHVAQIYAGRASAAPIIQFLAAVLSTGFTGYETLRDKQEENRKLLQTKLKRTAERHGERVLKVDNPIAAAMTLQNHNAKEVGFNLYSSRVTGPRVLEKTDFGVCCERYHSPYITMNAAIGSTESDILQAIRRLAKVLKESKS
ncbi:MAG: O-phosphoseryl-tRNA(Sec) selenium transferase [Candidatus Bathyarchaeota archaeon]|nr:MAG: O-phosphoseryl-tRNA(Sec) selenium transferase [Candidatus Bathyarchaeota archaeon]